MKKQAPRKTIKKKEYKRSKWDDFNKVKATFILKQFRLNIAQFVSNMSRLGQNTDQTTISPLTKWFLSLPKTQGRSQEIIRLAFIHSYEYTFGKGTEIGSFKNKTNPFFNEYLKLQNHPSIGIDKINIERQKHRQILRYTTEKVMRDYIQKKNQRKPGKRARITKKDIKEEEREQFFKQLQKFFNQLVKQPTKEQIAQEYEDPEEFDEDEKEYISENEYLDEDYESEEEEKMINPEACNKLISQMISQFNNSRLSEEEDFQYVPSPIQSRKSFSLSQFDLSPPLSVAQSEDELQRGEQQIPRKIKKTSSEDSDKLFLKKGISMDLDQTDQQFECTQKIIAIKKRERDFYKWNHT